jgi:hypothetical protein
MIRNRCHDEKKKPIEKVFELQFVQSALRTLVRLWCVLCKRLFFRYWSEVRKALIELDDQNCALAEREKSAQI